MSVFRWVGVELPRGGCKVVIMCLQMGRGELEMTKGRRGARGEVEEQEWQ